MHHCETNLNKKNFSWGALPLYPSQRFRHSCHSPLCPTHFLLPSGAYATWRRAALTAYREPGWTLAMLLHAP